MYSIMKFFKLLIKRHKGTILAISVGVLSSLVHWLNLIGVIPLWLTYTIYLELLVVVLSYCMLEIVLYFTSI